MYLFLDCKIHKFITMRKKITITLSSFLNTQSSNKVKLTNPDSNLGLDKLKSNYLTRLFKTFTFCLIISLSSCMQVPNLDGDYDNLGSDDWRALVLAEGQFGYGTGSITGLSYNSVVKQDLFRTVNGRTLGDVPQSITRIGDKFYIPVNNSQKIEVIDANTFKSIETMKIDQVCIPMHLVQISEDEALLTDQSFKGSSNLFIIDLKHNTERPIVKRTIPLKHSTFQAKVVGDKIFIGGSSLLVFDLDNITTEGKREVAGLDGSNCSVNGFTELCLDAQGKLWVMTTGGVARVNPDTEKVEKIIPIDGVDQYRDNIAIDKDAKYIYFNEGVNIYRINTFDGKHELLFTHSQNDEMWTTYCIAVSPENTIFMTRVLFGSISRAKVYEYNTKGEILKKYPDPKPAKAGRLNNYFKAGIFPRFIYFYDKK